jgi:hypothetical protein
MEKLDLTQILKDCPKGTKLYSPLFGEVRLVEIFDFDSIYPIKVQVYDKDGAPLTKEFAADGKYWNNEYINDECVLFPSKDCRDWSQFKAPKPAYNFKPFDRVLVRDTGNQVWRIAFFERLVKEPEYPFLTMNGISRYRYCIPYEGNECLVGTSDEPKVKEG